MPEGHCEASGEIDPLFNSVLLHGDFWEQGHAHQTVEIFAGVTYGCERLALTQEGSGLVHWVRVDHRPQT